MNSQADKLTVRQKYNQFVRLFSSIEHSSDRHDSKVFQTTVRIALQQLISLRILVTNLSLFSDNERLNEINTSYLPFAMLPFYEAVLLQKLLMNEAGSFLVDSSEQLKVKFANLRKAKIRIMEYLSQIESFGGVLTPSQASILDSFTKSYDPSNKDILSSKSDPAQRRAEKISNFKLEKELKQKLEILEDFYIKESEAFHDSKEDDITDIMDEDNIRALYIDKLRLFSMYAFRDLGLIAIELQVLESRKFDIVTDKYNQTVAKSQIDKLEYTTRLETVPTKHKEISELISTSGKILQPFVITRNKQKLRREVFGTGQTLPSMSVEEYLDYELANGKMLKSETKISATDSDDETDNSGDELEKRNWDDWKDENPKGKGNMKANIG